MRLTIKDETHEETIHGITLDNGIRPCISSINNDHGFNIPPIEPAMWFKTLILRSIVIDCVDNTICYSISDEEEHYLNGDVETTERNITGGATSNIRRLISEADLQESGKFHSDEVGDIFQRSKHELIEVKRTGNAMLFYENMFQILHCFVLPIIKFTKSDLNYLDASKEGEISIIQNQDQRIEAQQQDLSLIGNSLSAIRNDLVETLIAHHERYNGTDNMMRLKMDRVVATVIIADLKDDLKQCSYNLNYEQTVVDVLNRQREKLMYDCDTNDTGHDVMKERVRTSFHMENKRNSPAELEVLTQLFMKNSGLVNNRIEVARKKRNQVQTKQNKLLIARELIQDYVSKNKRQNSTFRRIMKKTQVKIKPLDKGRNTEYMYLHIRRKKLKAGLMELVMEKVVMISIREAIESTIKELASGDIKDESCGGLYNKSGTKKFTDVRGSARNNIPQNWQTMEEQIHNILTDPQNNIAHIHCEAFADFVFRCDIINAKLALKDHSSRENNGTEIADRYSANTEESSVATLEMLNKDIVDHMERICNELNMALKEKFNFNSIWLCYENELFCKVGPLLENINKLVFKNKLEDIEKYIKRIAPSSLGREFETSKVYSLLEETVITEALVNDKPDQQHTVGNSVENIERTNDHFLNSKDVKCQSENKDDCNSDQNSYSGTMSSSESSTEDEDDHTSSQLPSTSNASEIEENALIKTVTDAGNACVHRRTSSKKRLASNHGCDTKTRLDYSKSVPINSESIMSASIRVSRYGDLLQSLTSDIEVNRSPKRIKTWPYLLRMRMQSRSFFNSPIYASQDSSEVIGDKKVTNSGGHTSMIEPDYITFRETMVVQRQKADNLQEVNRKVNTMNLKPCYKEGFQKVISLITELSTDCGTISEMLKTGNRALQQLDSIGREYLKSQCIGSDELMDLLVVTFCNMDVEALQGAYIRVQMMKGLLPDFHSIGQLCYVMTTFYAVWYYLFQKIDEVKEKSVTLSKRLDSCYC